MTENTHPLCTKYIYGIIERLDLSNKLLHVRTSDFFELMDKWSPPLLFGWRWCLTQKNKLIKKHAYFITVSGTKRSDSPIRSKLPEFDFYKASKKLDVKPLLEWTDEDVYYYIKKHNIPINPCYEIYGHSGNCMFCPYADKKHIIGVMSDLEWKEKIEKILLKHEAKMMRGRIHGQIYKRWMKWNGQFKLTQFKGEGADREA